ncbi:hypothetical protein B0A48_04917 [Cryoendolithus antarcticus]|uniref:Uncharacterized protein n=1 Tax=Cryoendolithus antarcticus TaxID=1507870 RepID=A0A1V8TDR0_9PEZI|nr:hypothetical protein B0A48_04917 [Cryoendolithus antarcticus]
MIINNGTYPSHFGVPSVAHNTALHNSSIDYGPSNQQVSGPFDNKELGMSQDAQYPLNNAQSHSSEQQVLQSDDSAAPSTSYARLDAFGSATYASMARITQQDLENYVARHSGRGYTSEGDDVDFLKAEAASPALHPIYAQKLQGIGEDLIDGYGDNTRAGLWYQPHQIDAQVLGSTSISKTQANREMTRDHNNTPFETPLSRAKSTTTTGGNSQGSQLGVLNSAAMVSKPKKRTPKNTQTVVIDCSKLLVADCTQARKDIIRRVPLKLGQDVCDDTPTVAANSKAMILRIVDAFNKKLKTAADNASDYNDLQLQGFTDWQLMGDSKCKDVMRPHDDPSVLVQGRAWLFYDDVMDAHLNGQGPWVFEKEKIAGGSNPRLTCSQRFNEAIKLLSEYAYARVDFLTGQRDQEFVASPRGSIDRKIANMLSNLARARDNEDLGDVGDATTCASKKSSKKVTKSTKKKSVKTTGSAANQTPKTNLKQRSMATTQHSSSSGMMDYVLAHGTTTTTGTSDDKVPRHSTPNVKRKSYVDLETYSDEEETHVPRTHKRIKHVQATPAAPVMNFELPMTQSDGEAVDDDWHRTQAQMDGVRVVGGYAVGDQVGGGQDDSNEIPGGQ